MKRFLSNWKLKSLAVLAAIIFWFLVIGTENTFYAFPEEIPVKAFNVADDLIASEDLGTVKLRLKIDKTETIQNLTVEDFSAFIDLEDVSEGEGEYEVQITSKNKDVNVIKVEPAVIKVKLEEKSDKEVDLDYKLTGNTKDGFEVINVFTELDSIMIKGNSEDLENIDTAYVIVELNGEDEDFEKPFKVAVLDENDDEITNITSEIQEVNTSVDIELITGQKLVGVQPEVEGNPSNNVWIKSIQIEPSYLTLDGDPEALKNIEFIKTQKVDVSGLAENKTYYVTVTGLPEGVTVSGDSTVSVNVEVEQLGPESTLKTKTVSAPVFIKTFNQKQKDMKVNPPSVTIIAEGAPNDLKNIESKIQVELDISDIEENDARVEISEANVILPEGVNIQTVTPTFVRITWR